VLAICPGYVATVMGRSVPGLATPQLVPAPEGQRRSGAAAPVTQASADLRWAQREAAAGAASVASLLRPFWLRFTSVLVSKNIETQRPRVAGQPLRRQCAPEEIASVAVFLGTDAASFMSGTIVPIDGGCTATFNGSALQTGFHDALAAVQFERSGFDGARAARL
jgi:NAD(P)-dependent dehydrogenase (short-subunit alcohol dehydrogenase family)